MQEKPEQKAQKTLRDDESEVDEQDLLPKPQIQNATAPTVPVPSESQSAQVAGGAQGAPTQTEDEEENGAYTDRR